MIDYHYPPSATPGPKVVASGHWTSNGVRFIVVDVPQGAGPLDTAPAAVEAAGPEGLMPGKPAEDPCVSDDFAEPCEHERAEAPEPSEGEPSSTAKAFERVEVGVLGPERVLGWDTRAARRKTVELVYYLALHKNRSVGAEELRAALWSGDTGPDGSLKTLRTYVSLARESLGEDLLPRAPRGGGYRAGGALTSDWEVFSSLVSRADRLSDEEAAPLLEESLSLLRGTPFQGVEEGTFAWAGVLSAEIEVAVVKATRRLAAHFLMRGEPDHARTAVTRGLVAVPYDLTLWGLLLEASRRLGPALHEQTLRHARSVLGDGAALLSVID